MGRDRRPQSARAETGAGTPGQPGRRPGPGQGADGRRRQPRGIRHIPRGHRSPARPCRREHQGAAVLLAAGGALVVPARTRQVPPHPGRLRHGHGSFGPDRPRRADAGLARRHRHHRHAPFPPDQLHDRRDLLSRPAFRIQQPERRTHRCRARHLPRRPGATFAGPARGRCRPRDAGIFRCLRARPRHLNGGARAHGRSGRAARDDRVRHPPSGRRIRSAALRQ